MPVIERFEYQALLIGEEGFEQRHFNALLKLKELHGNAYFSVIYGGVRFHQYAGMIQVGDLVINIHPKADRDDDDARWRDVLIPMLKATRRLKPRTAGAAETRKQNLNLLEIYFDMYLREIDALVRQGLVKRYRQHTANTLALKGKLEFAGNIQRNLVHRERFYTTHQVYDTDHELHRLLAMALDVVEQFTRGTWLYDRCRRALLDFPDLSAQRIALARIDHIRLDRKTAPYKMAFDLARLIVLNYSPDVHRGRENMLSLLFDMNSLWEEYVVSQLDAYCRSSQNGWKVKGQDVKTFWGERTLRPDIVLVRGQEIIIVDTKWKRPDKGRPSSADLRQMYAYNRFWNCARSVLLYPGNGPDEGFIPFNEPENPSVCRVHFAEVSKADGSGLDPAFGKQLFKAITATQ